MFLQFYNIDMLKNLNTFVQLMNLAFLERDRQIKVWFEITYIADNWKTKVWRLIR